MSYYQQGCFEFRTPSVATRSLCGVTGETMELFLEHNYLVFHLAASTIEEKRRHLFDLNSYLESLEVSLDQITIGHLADFYCNMDYSQGKKRHVNSTIRQLLRYAYDTGKTSQDMSFVVMPVSKSPSKLPTTYTEDEIRRMLSTVERSSAIGKRDYLILLLAAEYGWRSSDIVNFSFSQIDWDKNTISFEQHKTGVAVQYPLLSSIGNAIIEYLKYGRPESNAQEVILAHDTIRRGRKLMSPTIHSIVTRYLRAANIENWKERKHGPHALRHSLATNLLKRNISIPIISTVLGHQSTESTKLYISLDIEQLRKSALQIPQLNTAIFEVAI